MGVAYIPVAKIGELGEGVRKCVDLGGRRVIVANLGGEHYVFGAECPHERAELELADINGTELICDGHSYRYDLRSGACVMPEGESPLPVLPVEQRDGEICVRLEW